jgi:hypothetical protein
MKFSSLLHVFSFFSWFLFWVSLFFSWMNIANQQPIIALLHFSSILSPLQTCKSFLCVIIFLAFVGSCHFSKMNILLMNNPPLPLWRNEVLLHFSSMYVLSLGPFILLHPFVFWWTTLKLPLCHFSSSCVKLSISLPFDLFFIHLCVCVCLNFFFSLQ